MTLSRVEIRLLTEVHEAFSIFFLVYRCVLGFAVPLPPGSFLGVCWGSSGLAGQLAFITHPNLHTSLGYLQHIPNIVFGVVLSAVPNTVERFAKQ